MDYLSAILLWNVVLTGFVVALVIALCEHNARIARFFDVLDTADKPESKALAEKWFREMLTHEPDSPRRIALVKRLRRIGFDI